MNNNLKVNAGKFHLFLSPYDDQRITVEEFLGVAIDSNLHVKEHILSLCKKENSKLLALSRVSKYKTLNKRHILLKSF